MNGVVHSFELLKTLFRGAHHRLPEDVQEITVATSCAACFAFFGLVSPMLVLLDYMLGLSPWQAALTDMASALVLALAFALLIIGRHRMPLLLREATFFGLLLMVTLSVLKAGRPLPHVAVFYLPLIIAIGIHISLRVSIVAWLVAFGYTIVLYKAHSPLSPLVETESIRAQAIYSVNSVLIVAILFLSIVYSTHSQHRETVRAEQARRQLLANRERGLGVLATQMSEPLADLDREITLQQQGASNFSTVQSLARLLELTFDNALVLISNHQKDLPQQIVRCNVGEMLHSLQRYQRTFFNTPGVTVRTDASQLPVPHFMLDEGLLHQLLSSIASFLSCQSAQLERITITATSERSSDDTDGVNLIFTVIVLGQEEAYASLLRAWQRAEGRFQSSEEAVSSEVAEQALPDTKESCEFSVLDIFALLDLLNRSRKGTSPQATLGIIGNGSLRLRFSIEAEYQTA